MKKEMKKIKKKLNKEHIIIARWSPCSDFMSERGKQNLKTTLIFALIGIIFAYTYMSMHEQVHVSILTSYGIESKSQLNWLSASTVPVNQTDYNEKCNFSCHMSMNKTDIIGYHLIVLIFCMTGLVFITQMIG